MVAEKESKSKTNQAAAGFPKGLYLACFQGYRLNYYYYTEFVSFKQIPTGRLRWGAPPSGQENQAEIHDVRPRRPGHDKPTDGSEEGMGIVVVEVRPWIESKCPHPDQD
jgi:hypothetical protein